jgi:hypothetical protein
MNEQTYTKEQVVHLAKCAIFALNYLKCQGSGCMVKTDPKDGSFKTMAWQEDFMDALESVGVTVDREEYWKRKDGKNPKKKAPADSGKEK